MAHDNDEQPYDAIVLGAGVAGIYQIKRLADLGVRTVLLEADDDLGGTWYRNRYPGARFDSESYTYGYSFSKELLEQWDWSERFSPQPETLRYLNFVADLFDLRPYMRFGRRVEQMVWSEDDRLWTLSTSTGETFRTRFVVTGVGVLSIPTLPRVDGVDDFTGPSFHTSRWPADGIDLTGKRVGIIGTGATAIQIIPAIAGEVGELTVFQRRPNWSVPLNNSLISPEEMAEIRARYDEIFANCDVTPGGFEHVADRRGFENLTPAERREFWDQLYDEPGFSILLANFPETFFDSDANQELSDYVADRIRNRVDDPEVAEKLIPRDHGFGMQRLPLETNYFEAYNRPNVRLVDLSEAPIERVTATGLQTTAGHHDLDVLVYATGFDSITGALMKIDIRGVDGEALADRWADGPSTYLGTLAHGYPNLLMIAGPQSVSGSTNYPRALQNGVDWVTELLEHANDAGHTRIEVTVEGEEWWGEEVAYAQSRMPFGQNSKSWFTGYNSNLDGRTADRPRHQAYWGGAPRFRRFLEEAAAEGYARIDLR